MSRVHAALRRIGTSPPAIADLQQGLRERLAEMTMPDPRRKSYGGLGDLAAWLCIAAVREAGRGRTRAKREEHLDDADAAMIGSPDDDPEMAHLRETHKAEFRKAFQEALESLSSRERNLLRYHFIDGLTIDRLGQLYGVHRATAARWVNQAREALCLKTRDLLADRVSLSREGFYKLLGLIDSEVSVHMVDAAPEEGPPVR